MPHERSAFQQQTNEHTQQRRCDTGYNSFRKHFRQNLVINCFVHPFISVFRLLFTPAFFYYLPAACLFMPLTSVYTHETPVLAVKSRIFPEKAEGVQEVIF